MKEYIKYQECNCRFVRHFVHKLIFTFLNFISLIVKNINLHKNPLVYSYEFKRFSIERTNYIFHTS